ncbi:MAG: type 1 glutamine amidotransferase [Actinobacteria bacterium]|nr:type 1 glutamine amidotransferase [Actinomycetota bacterium]
MRALIVQHHDDGPAGLLEDHLRARGYEVDAQLVMQPGSTHNDEPFPDPELYDVVVPLGSVYGVYQHDLIGSWIHREVEMLASAHRAGVPVFGICFGAQAITTALGGHVEPAPAHEIGWYEYESEVPDVIAPGPWFTWHGDRCVLPDGVDLLARNEMCPQAFRSGSTVGVQFHPEVTKELVAGWTAKLPSDYFIERGTTLEHVLDGFDAHGELTAARAAALFDWFLDDVAS